MSVLVIQLTSNLYAAVKKNLFVITFEFRIGLIYQFTRYGIPDFHSLILK